MMPSGEQFKLMNLYSHFPFKPQWFGGLAHGLDQACVDVQETLSYLWIPYVQGCQVGQKHSKGVLVLERVICGKSLCYEHR